MGRVVRRLERLGDSLLDFARVRTGECRPTDLRAVVEEAATLVKLDREARDVKIVNMVPPRSNVECDSDRFVQVLVNILRNAVDAVRRRPPLLFGDDGAVISVELDRAEREGREWVSLTVTDNGPGIDPEILPRLFEPFASTRLDARGTGLGLAVADGIVREQGGVILARNRAGSSGSIFEIVIPGAAAASSAPQPASTGISA
jgi:two-component system C4-dicarboxylate transport sensor histidine kinase DctB